MHQLLGGSRGTRGQVGETGGEHDQDQDGSHREQPGGPAGLGDHDQQPGTEGDAERGELPAGVSADTGDSEQRRCEDELGDGDDDQGDMSEVEPGDPNPRRAGGGADDPVGEIGHRLGRTDPDPSLERSELLRVDRTRRAAVEVGVSGLLFERGCLAVESSREQHTYLGAAHVHWSTGRAEKFPRTARNLATIGAIALCVATSVEASSTEGSDVDDLTALAMQARDGDRAAITAFVRASQADVWRLCAHLVDPGAADDLTQDTYLRALPALARFRGDASARTWLLGIARRTCADAIRSRQRQRTLVDRLARRHHHQDAQRPDTTSEPVVLDDAIAALDDDRRGAFVLTQIIGLSYQEAADACDCPLGTIRSRVARARAELVAALGPGTEDVAEI